MATTPERWYLGSQNDGLFILNKPPRPSNDHPVHEFREGISPTLVIPLGDLDIRHAQAIVDAHNATVPE
jgi:hypothetical protein